MADVLADPASGDLVVTAMEEVDAVATALGIPVRRTRTEAVLADSVAGLPDFETSMLQDYRRGRRLEHDALNGAGRANSWIRPCHTSGLGHGRGGVWTAKYRSYRRGAGMV